MLSEFDKRLESRMEFGEAGENLRFKKLLEKLRNSQPGMDFSKMRILNVACGYMREFEVLTELFENPIYGIDSDSNRIESLKTKSLHHNLIAINGDASKLQKIFPRNSFKFVFARHPDIYSDDWLNIFRSCYKVLEPGGYIAATFYIRNELDKAIEILEKLGVEICDEGINEFCVWENGIEDFYAIDGYYLLARKKSQPEEVIIKVNNKIFKLIQTKK